MKEIPKWILENLCNYDTRNPDGIISYLTDKEIKEEGFTTQSKSNCACDNCFYGKTKLSEYIIDKILEEEDRRAQDEILEEIKKCKDSPYYFATKYLKIKNHCGGLINFATLLSEKEFNEIFKNYDTSRVRI